MPKNTLLLFLLCGLCASCVSVGEKSPPVGFTAEVTGEIIGMDPHSYALQLTVLTPKTYKDRTLVISIQQHSDLVLKSGEVGYRDIIAFEVRPDVITQKSSYQGFSALKNARIIRKNPNPPPKPPPRPIKPLQPGVPWGPPEGWSQPKKQ